jgi:hypothetical protein
LKSGTYVSFKIFVQNYYEFISYVLFLIIRCIDAKAEDLIQRKISKLNEIRDQLLSSDKSLRPNCAQILNENSEWILCLNEMKNDNEFKRIISNKNKTQSLEESFHCYFIRVRVYSPTIYSPTIYSPTIYSPTIYSPTIYSPTIHSPTIHSPTIYSPTIYSPTIHSPTIYSPTIYSPTIHSLTIYSPTVYLISGWNRMI